MTTIKLICFDLDGVLVPLKDAHYYTLNSAIKDLVGSSMCISMEEHYKFYDGLPTRKKLELLVKYKGLSNSKELHEKISKLKQKYTLLYIYDHIKRSPDLYDTFESLKDEGYSICVASNSVANTIYSVLVRQELLQFVDQVFSNENVKHPKPNPEIYFKAISHFGLTPKECLIIEDSPYGLDAARESGSHVMRVNGPAEVTYKNIKEKITMVEGTNFKTTTWDGAGKYNVLIPMAGAGSRFEQAGYKDPKPLIQVMGTPMIQKVVQNLGIDANFIFLVQKKHEEKYNVSTFLKKLARNVEVVFVDGLTEGAACTTLLAKDLINNDKHLIIANSDQFVEWDSERFYYKQENHTDDACILTFKSTHPKWSYAKLEDGYVTEVAEKKPISDNATVGIYLWNKGSDYVKYAEQMISKNIRVNNEFYVCPVFNEAIVDGKKISTYEVDKMWGLGTPEDLVNFLENYKE
jgi:HAD superfamily hydrolase (TIGR01509 family)